MAVSVHIEKALPDDLGGASVFVHISIIHLELLRIIHDFRLIAVIESRQLTILLEDFIRHHTFTIFFVIRCIPDVITCIFNNVLM